MTEKVRLTLWDFFVYVLTGTAVGLSVAVHCYCTGACDWSCEMKDIASLFSTVVLALLLLLLVGMLLEPLANGLTKLGALSSWGLGQWDKHIGDMEKHVRKMVPEWYAGSCFGYCKNWILAKGCAGQYEVFLARFGFYRNISAIFAANAIAALPLYWGWWDLLIVPVLVGLSLLYLHRSRVFHRHVSETVYTQFLIAHEPENGAQCRGQA